MQSTTPTFAEINQIKGRIDALDNRIKSLKIRYDEIIDALDPAEESIASAKLEEDESEIRKDLKDLKGTIQIFKQYPDFNKIAGALQRRLGILYRNYQEERRIYKERKDLQSKRRYGIIGGEVPASHLEVENGPIFANHLLEIDKHYQSTDALSNVKYRHNEIQDIEAEFIELAELFQEAGELVDKQEEPIKAIELNNEQAVEQLEEGNTEVKKAIKHTRFRNNKKWWALLIAGM